MGDSGPLDVGFPILVLIKTAVLHSGNIEHVKFIPKVIHSARGHPSVGPWRKEYLGLSIPNALQKVRRKLHHIMREMENRLATTQLLFHTEAFCEWLRPTKSNAN